MLGDGLLFEMGVEKASNFIIFFWGGGFGSFRLLLFLLNYCWGFKNYKFLEKMHYMDSNKMAGEEARWQLHKNAASNLEQVLAATPHKTPTVWPPASYHENYSS